MIVQEGVWAGIRDTMAPLVNTAQTMAPNDVNYVNFGLPFAQWEEVATRLYLKQSIVRPICIYF